MSAKPNKIHLAKVPTEEQVSAVAIRYTGDMPAAYQATIAELAKGLADHHNMPMEDVRVQILCYAWGGAVKALFSLMRQQNFDLASRAIAQQESVGAEAPDFDQAYFLATQTGIYKNLDNKITNLHNQIRTHEGALIELKGQSEAS